MSGITMKSSTADFSAAPLGFVNINPLPDDLPAGLGKLLLTRKSTAASSFDRQSGDPSVLQTMKDGSGDITFSATHLTVEDTASGLIDTSFVNSYEDGFTIIGVMRFDQVGTDDAHIFSNTSWNNSTKEGWRVLANSEATGVNFRMQAEDGTGDATMTYTVHAPEDPAPDGWFLFAAIWNPAGGTLGSVTLAYPHSNRRYSNDLVAAAKAALPDDVLAMLYDPWAASHGTDSHVSLAMMAYYPSVLTTVTTATGGGQVEDFYSKIKPWLLARDVTIL
ncbi:hypothetical protein [Pacificibacter marinus]|uniref:Uncharacterized protein n=1 Tax=Pacificibacter marinus TaxID=658057 RepID=A0A1Y5SZ17_9RHOB|nr:hypothetical protein [Pacificibacter marinus]SEK85732.1 hypothetical protein SAMN04488032_107135 [Pacificibacter marinus]SLN49846.1 hypothetical protein PAM7971_02456 [Pacificibacter marinus]